MYAPPPEGTSYTSDIWSLGATLFFLVFGKLPFQKRNVFETYDAICREELKFPETPKVRREVQWYCKHFWTLCADSPAFAYLLGLPGVEGTYYFNDEEATREKSEC